VLGKEQKETLPCAAACAQLLLLERSALEQCVDIFKEDAFRTLKSK
jgi:hypothetical protein